MTLGTRCRAPARMSASSHRRSPSVPALMPPGRGASRFASRFARTRPDCRTAEKLRPRGGPVGGLAGSVVRQSHESVSGMEMHVRIQQIPHSPKRRAYGVFRPKKEHPPTTDHPPTSHVPRRPRRTGAFGRFLADPSSEERREVKEDEGQRGDQVIFSRRGQLGSRFWVEWRMDYILLLEVSRRKMFGHETAMQYEFVFMCSRNAELHPVRELW